MRRLLFILKKRELPSFRAVPYIASFALGVASMVLLRYMAKVISLHRSLVSGPFSIAMNYSRLYLFVNSLVIICMNLMLGKSV